MAARKLTCPNCGFKTRADELDGEEVEVTHRRRSDDQPGRPFPGMNATCPSCGRLVQFLPPERLRRTRAGRRLAAMRPSPPASPAPAPPPTPNAGAAPAGVAIPPAEPTPPPSEAP